MDSHGVGGWLRVTDSRRDQYEARQNISKPAARSPDLVLDRSRRLAILLLIDQATCHLGRRAAIANGILGRRHPRSYLRLDRDSRVSQARAGLTFSLVVAGQMVVALVLEHFNLLVAQPQPISLGRILGVTLIVGGVVLMKQF